MIRVGVNPIAWRNGDFPELGCRGGLSRCLSEIRRAGYDGTELGPGFPGEPHALRALLDAHGLELVSGWYPSHVLAGRADEEERSFGAFVGRLAAVGSRYVVVAELSRCVQRDRREALRFRVGPGVLTPLEWDRLARGIERLAAIAGERGVALVYHPHMGTLVQELDQVHELVERTSERVRLTADTGHIRFAGDDPAAFLSTFRHRIGLVHLKDVRAPIVDRFTRAPASFYDAVMAGVFTVPGDGDIDFSRIYATLLRARYDGWLVVEAEQDPEKANPFVYSMKGRDAIRAALGV